MDEKLLQKMAAYCSKSEHCEQDVREKLRGADDAEKIIEWLKNEKFIDNERYARAYVKDKFRFNHWGKIKIRMMLVAKAIPKDLIDEVLSEIDEENYIEVLRELIDAQRQKIKATSDYEMRGKLFRFAAGRGFEGKAISEVLK